jgi:hypothetical protein
MATRMIISRDSPAIECEVCGRPALHVAKLVADNGGEVGKTVVCVSCRRQQAELAATDGRGNGAG